MALPMSNWSNELIIQFLELYESEPTIYNPNHSDYKNKTKIYEAWMRIKHALNEDIPLDEIKRKKDSLMASFRHHLRRKKASIKSGASVDEVYKPMWYAYEIMEKFLGPVYDCDPAYSIKSLDPLEGIEEYIKEEVSMSEENSSSNDDSPKPMCTRQRSTAARLPTQVYHSKLPKELQHVTQEMDPAFGILSDKRKQDDDDDECDLYGKLIAKKLRKIPETAREELMYEIDGLFLNAKNYQTLIHSEHPSSS